MSFFSRFQKKESNSGELMTWATNAPDHWPKLTTPSIPHPNPTMPAQEGVNLIFFLARLSEALKPLGDNCTLVAVAQNRLTEGGLLKIPIVVKDHGVLTTVLMFPQVHAQSAGMFAGTTQVLREMGEPAPIYFAPEPLPDVEPKPELFPFHPNWLNKADGVAEADYAMWRQTAEDSVFTQSPAIESIRRAYELSDGASSYILAAILQQLEIIPAKTPRAQLPADLATIPVVGPENQPIIISASAEKGLRFHFHPDTPASYRNLFWKFFAEFCNDLRMQILRAGLPLDDPSAPWEWWQATEKLIRHKQDSFDPGTAVGSISWRK